MKVTYQVHRASDTDMQMEVTLLSGEKSNATVKGFEIELVPVNDPNTGTLKVTFVGSDADAARAAYQAGMTMEIDWAALASQPTTVQPAAVDDSDAAQAPASDAQTLQPNAVDDSDHAAQQ